jgi:hypothetical protein
VRSITPPLVRLPQQESHSLSLRKRTLTGRREEGARAASILADHPAP